MATTTAAVASTTTTVLPGNHTYPVDDDVCGRPKIDLKFKFMQRIVGGHTSTYGTIPWQAALYKRDVFICGAVLIDRNTVLTAAHCFQGRNDPDEELYSMIMGKHHKSTTAKDEGEILAKVKSILIHPEYDTATLDNDIAIMKLATPVSYSDHVLPACLPRPSKVVPVGRSLLVSGWGETKDTNNNGEVLQQVELRKISNSDCNTWLHEIFGTKDEITSNMMCAGYKEGKKDACQGDSGGPLVMRDGDAHVLVGLVSWGYGCGDTSRPGIYTRVQNYIEWINAAGKQR